MLKSSPLLFREHVQCEDCVFQSLKKKYQQNIFNVSHVMQKFYLGILKHLIGKSLNLFVALGLSSNDYYFL